MRPSESSYRPFRLEEGTIVGVNRKNWTVDVDTRHSSKPVRDIQCMVPYHHWFNGEGFHYLPEVGAVCMLAWPNDHTPPLVMGYKGMPAAVTEDSTSGEPSQGGGPASPNSVSFQSRRPDLNPGDIAFTGRDENFVIARRGGILQLGATALCQRIYIPVMNYIKDFAENYQMQTPGGEMKWAVQRQELDPSGKAAVTWHLLLNEYAQDSKASVVVRHFNGTTTKSAWEVQVAPQGIDTRTGEIVGSTYRLVVAMNGDRTEFIGGDITSTVSGDYSLSVGGSHTTTVTGDATLTAASINQTAQDTAVLAAPRVALGNEQAVSPAAKGDELIRWMSTQAWPINPTTGLASPTPAAIALLRAILATNVFVE